MGLPRLSIKHPVTTLMVMLIAVVIGLGSLINTPMDLLPKMNTPVAVVMTAFPGASPEEVSNLVTKPLEDAVATTAGLTDMTSTSQEHMSLVVLQFDWGTDMSEARALLQQAIDRVDLPDGAQKPSLIKFDPSLMPVMELTVASGEDLSKLKRQIEAEIQPRLEKVDGVAAVTVTGAPDPEIQVRLNQEKLVEYGLTQSQVASVIQASNLTYPAGRVDVSDQSLNLRIVGKTSTVDQLKSLVVSQAPDLSAVAGAAGRRPGAAPGSAAGVQLAGQVPMKPIRLGDVAEVVATQADATVINRTNGRPSLQITIQKEGEANTVAVSKAVNKEIEDIRKDIKDIDLVTVLDQGELISLSVNNVAMSLVGGGLLAVLVLLVFLRNLRPTLIIGIAIPFSVIVTFVLLFMGKLSINIMTLGGLALGVGMLVDNAIVVIENIYRHLTDLGEEPAVAAERGANEVAGAITSSTLTTVAVFLPVVFVGGLTGELFKELSLTVSFSLLASLAVALTVVPMMASRFLRRPRKERSSRHGAEGRFSGYTRFLRWALGHRAITLAVVFALLAGSIALVPQIGTEFIPAADEGSFTIKVVMPQGTPLAVTAAKVDELAAVVADELPAELVTTSAGRPEGLAGLSQMTSGGGSAGDGTIKVSLKEDYDHPTIEAIQEVRDALDKVKGNAVLTYNVESNTTGGGMRPSNIQVIVTGPDVARVRELVGDVEAEMKSVEGISSLENNLDSAKSELQVVVNQEKAMRNGLVPGQVAVTVADAVKGRVVTRVDEDGKSTDVRVLYRKEDRDQAAKLDDLQIRSPFGKNVKLSELAEVRTAFGPVSITRENQKPSAQITGLIEGRDLGSVTMDIQDVLDGLDIPDGYSVKMGGSSQLMSEGLGSLGYALIFAILLVYMIMAAQFESLLHPFTILFTMPLAGIGVIAGLFVTGDKLGITAMIGVIILAGIVVNNGIVLVDYINQLRQRGMDLTEAIIEAGRSRTRPILMTAITTILGLLPLAIGVGEGAEIQAPMAVTVIGGLLTSTALTLVIIPVMYHLLAGRRSPARASMEPAPIAPGPVTVADAGPPAAGSYEAAPSTDDIAARHTAAEAGEKSLSPAEADWMKGRTSLSSEEFSVLLRLLGKLFTASVRDQQPPRGA